MSPWILLIWIPFLLLITGFPNQWTGEGDLLNDERIKLHREETTRLVSEMEGNSIKSTNKAGRLHNGLPNSKRNIPIKELMDGFRGLL